MLVEVLSHAREGHEFNSRSEHIPMLRVHPLFGVRVGGNQQIEGFTLMFLSFFPLKLIKISKSIIISLISDEKP